jgi:Tfp pilus assembly protein PilN
MAASKKQINLLLREEWEKTSAGRLIKWALTIGRYIVIVTELIVIIAFISRFKFDRDLTNLYEDIEIKRARIKSTQEFEEEFRLVQRRLITIKELEQKKTSPIKIVANFASLVPLNVILSDLSFDQDQLAIDGYAFSESGLATLINNLKQSPYFTNIRIEDITKEPDLEINFRLITSVKSLAKSK